MGGGRKIEACVTPSVVDWGLLKKTKKYLLGFVGDITLILPFEGGLNIPCGNRAFVMPLIWGPMRKKKRGSSTLLLGAEKKEKFVQRSFEKKGMRGEEKLEDCMYHEQRVASTTENASALEL